MLRLMPILCLLLLSSQVSAQAPGTASGIALQWKLTPGKKLAIKMEQNTSQSMNIGGNPMNNKSDTTTYMTWEVMGNDEDGNALVDTVLRRVLMTMNAPMVGEVKFDSSSEEEPEGMAAQLGGVFKPMIGVPIQQTMNSRGEILEVNIPEAAVAGLAQGGNMGPLGSPKNMLEQMAKNASLAFPEEDLEIGTSWERKAEMATPIGAIEVTNTYQYAGVTKQDDKLLHKIDVDVTMAFKPGDNPMNVKIEVKDQDTTGALYFNAEEGMLDHSEVEQNVTMLISAQGQEITQQMKQVLKASFESMN